MSALHPDLLARLCRSLEAGVVTVHPASGERTPLTRAKMKNISARWLLIPCMDAPRLVFDREDEARAEWHRIQMARWRDLYLHTADKGLRARALFRLRLHHKARVNRSIGISFASWCRDGVTRVLEWADA